VFSGVKAVRNVLAARARPRTTLGEITALSRPIAGLRGRRKEGKKRKVEEGK